EQDGHRLLGGAPSMSARAPLQLPSTASRSRMWPSCESEEALVRSAQAYLQSRGQNNASNVVLEQAWDRLYALYTPQIRRMAHICHVASGDMEDLIQEVWTKVIVSLPDLQWDGTAEGFRAWLFTLVRSRSVDLFRRNARRAELHLSRLTSAVWEP